MQVKFSNEGGEGVSLSYYRDGSETPFATTVVPVAPFLPIGLSTEEVIKALRPALREWMDQRFRQ